MHKRKVWEMLVSGALTAMACSSAQAIPVVDAGAIAQLIQQINYWKQQIQGMTDQLSQLRTSYESMTGGRGMEQLLSGTARNYLPSDWSTIADALGDLAGSSSVLSDRVRRAADGNAVLSAEDLARFSEEGRRAVEQERRLTAMNQVMTADALANTSQRFSSIQQLINAIPRATDPKAILDLQARIGAEQAMLQNEQTKLQMLNQTLVAQELARKQRVREQAIVDIGSFRDLPPLELP